MDRDEVNKDVSSSFESHFGMLNDPRIDRSKLYPLSEILFIVLSASICGAESMLNNAKKLVNNVGLKALRKKAGWGNETLAFILNQKISSKS